MKLAERLYTSGYLSYPRTESSKHPPGSDLRVSNQQWLVCLVRPILSWLSALEMCSLWHQGLLQVQAQHPYWGEHVRQLLDGQFTAPRGGGVDAGDHPPITPLKAATDRDVSMPTST
jgi:DNA topoisomerase-3